MESRRWIFTWVVIAVAMFSQGCGSASDSESIKPKNTKPKGYSLSEKEDIVFNHLIKEELNTSLGGGDTLLMEGMISTSAKEVAAAYRENEVAADQAYFKKTLMLSAKVHEINSSLGNEPVLSLFGVEMFHNPKAYFKVPDIDRIAKISKGSQQKLVCIGNGIRLGIVVFNKCEFADKYFSEKVDEFKSDVIDGISGKSKISENGLSAVILSIAMARVLPENSICFKAQKKCAGEIEKIEKLITADLIKSIASDLKSAGIKIDDSRSTRKSELFKLLN